MNISREKSWDIPYRYNQESSIACSEINLALPGKWTVKALRLDGSAYGPVATSQTDEGLAFKASTALFPGGIMLYQLQKTAVE